MSYWLISLSTKEKGSSAKENLDQLQQKVVDKQLAGLDEFKIPKLRVGTLDTLMVLSDDLAKNDSYAESLAKRISRAYLELKENNDGQLTVGEGTPDDYVRTFDWDLAKYSTALSLPDILSKILTEIYKTDDEMKSKMTKYNEVKSALGALSRKEQGTLLVKPIGPLVDKEDIIEREYLTTLFVVVPLLREQEFLSTYTTLEKIVFEERQKAELERAQNKDESADAKAAEKKVPEAKGAEAAPKVEEAPKVEKKNKINCENVVPLSAKAITKDEEFVLYRVVLFKKGLDSYKNACREKRFTVRPFHFDANEIKNQQEQKVTLENQKTKLYSNLVRWCTTTYADVFKAWIHIKAIRLFVESALRYGVPLEFVAVLLKPKKNAEKKLRGVLNDMYKHLANAKLVQALDSSENDISGVGNEFYPYVSLTLNVGEEAR